MTPTRGPASGHHARIGARHVAKACGELSRETPLPDEHRDEMGMRQHRDTRCGLP